MYRRAAYPIANMLADIPFSATRIFVYNVVIYFMTHLNRSAGGFWTYHLIVYLTFLVMQTFFRAFRLIFHDFDTAFRISVIFFLHILQYVGVWVPLAAMKRWLFWIVSCFVGVNGDVLVAYASPSQYYINPLASGCSLSLEAQLMNMAHSGMKILIKPGKLDIHWKTGREVERNKKESRDL